MWEQPPSAVRWAQPCCGGELDSVKFYGIISNIMKSKRSFRSADSPFDFAQGRVRRLSRHSVWLA